MAKQKTFSMCLRKIKSLNKRISFVIRLSRTEIKLQKTICAEKNMKILGIFKDPLDSRWADSRASVKMFKICVFFVLIALLGKLKRMHWKLSPLRFVLTVHSDCITLHMPCQNCANSVFFRRWGNLLSYSTFQLHDVYSQKILDYSFQFCV